MEYKQTVGEFLSLLQNDDLIRIHDHDGRYYALMDTVKWTKKHRGIKKRIVENYECVNKHNFMTTINMWDVLIA